MKSSSNIAFTLIELLIVITIFVLISLLTYAPYTYYQKKNSIKNTGKQISQLINKARNLAVNGVTSSSGNRAIGLYFSHDNNNKIVLLSYPFNIVTQDIDKIETGDIKILETYVLEPGIQIDNLDDKSNLLFFFDSITGAITYYYWDDFGVRHLYGSSSLDSSEEITIKFSYEGSDSRFLKKEIHYLTETNVINY